MLSVKIKQGHLLSDGKNVSDSIAYFTRVYNMICLIFPSTSQLALIG